MTVLEYAAFFMAFLSCLLYGRTVAGGSSVGVVSALMFIVWGTLRDIPAAVVTNIGFLTVNSYNFYRWRINVKR